MFKVTIENGMAILSIASGLDAFERNKRPMLNEIGSSLLGSIQEGFGRESSPEGQPWEPLKPATIKQRKGDAHPILRRNAWLYKSITKQVGTDSVLVGTSLAYAKAHQFGAVITRKAGTVKLHFRRYKRGKHKGKTLFAKEGKAQYGMQAATPAYKITIPARPYLFRQDGRVPETWEKPVLAIVLRHLGVAHA